MALSSMGSWLVSYRPLAHACQSDKTSRRVSGGREVHGGLTPGYCARQGYIYCGSKASKFDTECQSRILQTHTADLLVLCDPTLPEYVYVLVQVVTSSTDSSREFQKGLPSTRLLEGTTSLPFGASSTPASRPTFLKMILVVRLALWLT